MESIPRVKDEDMLERGEQVLGAGGHRWKDSWRTCLRAVRSNDFEIKIISTSAFLWFVGFVLRVTLALLRVSRRGEEGGERLPLMFLLRRKSAEDGTDDDRDYPIWQQVVTRTNTRSGIGTYIIWATRRRRRLAEQARKEKENIKEH